ncbi:MAG: TRAM domain-containing protein, partial [Ignavibacterium sp.]|nr:TRAM domain-containing protein [Ignavibacterium sp.]
MNRTYTVEHYLNLIEKARKIIPGVSFSTDIIAGFPTETWEDHLATLEVMKTVRYDGAYMFKYSPREGTKAYKMRDDVPDDVKTKRLQEIIDLQQTISFEKNQELIGKEEIVLVEGFSRKSEKFFSGRTDTNKVVVFPINDSVSVGDYVKIKINRATSATLFGDYIEQYQQKDSLVLKCL